MKPILLTAWLFAIIYQTYAQKSSIDFLNGTLPEIIKEAQNFDKLIYINMTATWCKPCKEMERTTYADETVINYFSNHFLSKKIYIDDDINDLDSISLNFKNKSNTVPTFYFLDAYGNVLFKAEGLKTPTELLVLGEKAKNIISPEFQISKMQTAYFDNKNNKAFLLKYMNLKNEIGEKDTNALSDYLKLIPVSSYCQDSVIKTIINNESNIYGIGYNILSSENYQTEASVIASGMNKNISIGYEMYKASLDIIKENAKIAANNKDKYLLKFCISEINRVMQNKANAEELAYKFILQYENENGKIVR